MLSGYFRFIFASVSLLILAGCATTEQTESTEQSQLIANQTAYIESATHLNRLIAKFGTLIGISWIDYF